MNIENLTKKTRFYVAYTMVVLLLFVASAHAVAISDNPPEAVARPAPPTFMIIMDDSGSMTWSTLNRGSSEGLFFVGSDSYSNIYSSGLYRYWRSKWSGQYTKDDSTPPTVTASSQYNAMAYNPKIVYKPWYGMANASVTTPYSTHPKNTSDKQNLTTTLITINGVDIKISHYFIWKGSKAYLVNLDGSINVHSVDGNGNGYIGNTDAEMSPDPVSVTITRDLNGDGTEETVTYADEIQNFANWFQYHRTRWLAAVGAITHMLPKFSGVKVGILSIHNRIVVGAVPVKVKNEFGVIEDQSNLIIDPLTSRYADVSGGTPLRDALSRIGKYIKNGESTGAGKLGPSPMATKANGGECQQHFTMLFTDGFRNTDSDSSFSYVGNADKDTTNVFDGEPYEDQFSFTLADIAMYYYKNDLSATLANKVFQSAGDKASHQHMVTYTVGFGLDGQLKQSDYPDIFAKNPPWPEPKASTLTTIDDLWHAAVNGRGEYIAANDSKELEAAFARIAEDVSARSASAASVAINGTEVVDGLKIFQSTYNSAGWSGNLKAKTYPSTGNPPKPDFTKTPVKAWVAGDAAQQLSDRDHTTRKIITYDGTAGIPFRYTSLTSAQKLLLDSNATTAEAILNYVRGDHSKEERFSGGVYRNRKASEVGEAEYNSKIGDIVHSSPTVADHLVYVGANDGMLHAFSVETGSEIFAYIPNHVFANLKDLADPDYSHKYYVDLTPFAKQVDAEHYLVGGLGKGGKGVYCLNITNAKGFNSSSEESDVAKMVKWEYPATPGIDNDMGYSFSKPYIVRTKAAGWVVIFGNGYNSASGKAALYVVSLTNGSVVKKFDTGIAGGNGLSTPNIIDVDADGFSDYVYAGDLKGNIWKFEIRSSNLGDWSMAYGANPLFSARDSAGNPQPITSRPDAMFHCQAGLPGYLIVFGTGKLLDANSDNLDTSQQTIYGIWDYGDDADNTEFVGTMGTRGGSSASIVRSPVKPNISLLKQSVELVIEPDDDPGDPLVEPDPDAVKDGTIYDKVVVLTANEAEWLTQADSAGQNPDPSDASPNHVGWFFDLPNSKERVVTDIIIRSGNAIVVSSIPAASSETVPDPCSPNGQSWLYEMSACKGGRPDNGHFDVNNDGKIDDNDKVEIDDPDNPGQKKKVPVTGVHYSRMIYPPAIANEDGNTEMKFMGAESGGIATMREKAEKMGVFYWRSF